MTSYFLVSIGCVGVNINALLRDDYDFGFVSALLEALIDLFNISNLSFA